METTMPRHDEIKRSFESPRFLLSQTRKKITEFEAITSAAIKHGRHSTVIDVDPKTGNKTYKVVFHWSVPDEARHIAATAISDIRHALDQSLCSSAESLTGIEPDKLYFPFATNMKDLAGRIAKPIPSELHPFVCSLKPYPSGEWGDGNDLLCQLSKSSGGNKHRVTCSAVGQVVGILADMFEIDKAIEVRLPPAWDTRKNEMILGTVAPDGNLKAKFQLTFYIGFGDAGQLTGQSVTGVVNNLLPIANRIVDGFEAETVRIIGARS